MSSLTAEQQKRYARQLILEEIGEAGQIKLLQTKMLVVGTGGLGSPAASYLAAAGVGTLGVVDCDVVELSNLNRQLLHSSQDIGVQKTASAEDSLNGLNPNVMIVIHETRITSENCGEQVAGYDLVLDCTDNYETRFILNDACVAAGLPLIHGGVSRFGGQAFVVVPGHTPCYRCLFPDIPPQDPGVPGFGAPILGATAGVIGTIQAMEALKWVLGIGTPLLNRILIFNGLDMTFREMKVFRDPDCPVCGR